LNTKKSQVTGTDKTYKKLILVIIALAIVALMYNLGIMSFIGDEALRSLVSMEMHYRNNYIMPTTNGEFYFSKPPLYNWILLTFFYVYGSVDEWIARFPTVIFTLLFTFTIYHFYKNTFETKRWAILLALMFLTCGRIMFWDSFLALIDIFFSLLMFLMFMLAYRFGHKENKWMFFFSLYGLGFLGFMLKGFPAPMFLAITMMTYITMYKKWSWLLSKFHLFNVLIFGGFVALYYYLYNQSYEASETVAPLLEQATKRTILKYPVVDVLKHIVTYPFENLYHFLPWSIFALLLIRPDFIKKIKENDLINYSFWCFIANVSVYWVSPEVFPRYVLMLVPLIFAVFTYFLQFEIKLPTWRLKIANSLLYFIALILPVGVYVVFFVDETDVVNHLVLKTVFISILMAVTIWLIFKYRQYFYYFIVIDILLLRIFFDAVIMPSRAVYSHTTQVKNESIALARKYEPLHVYKDTRLFFNNLFYITNEKDQLIDKQSVLLPQHFYVIDSLDWQSNFADKTMKVDSVMDGEFRQKRYVIKLK